MRVIHLNNDNSSDHVIKVSNAELEVIKKAVDLLYKVYKP